MKKFVLLSFVLFLSKNILFPQVQGIMWENTIQGYDKDYLKTAIPTNDGGYLLGGYSNSNSGWGDKQDDSNGGLDLWILKLNESGEIEWQKTIGGDEDESLAGEVLIQLDDGSFLIGANSQSGISGDKTSPSYGERDFWVLKLDNVGNILWQKSYGGSDVDFLYKIVTTADGGFAVTGFSMSNISGNKTEDSKGEQDYWFVRLDSDGNILWDKTLGGAEMDVAITIVELEDGGFFLGGLSESNISGDKSENSIGLEDFWLVKLNESGEIVWDKTIGGSGPDFLVEVVYIAENEYFLVGFSQSDISGQKSENSRGEDDFWVVSIDSLGNVNWDKTIGGNSSDRAYSSFVDEGGNVIIGGYSESGISGEKSEESKGLKDYWIIKIDTEGELIWDKTIGGSNTDWFSSIKKAHGDGYIVSGHTRSPVSGDKSENSSDDSFWVVKTGLCEAINNDVYEEGGTIYATETGYIYQWINCNSDTSVIVEANDQSYTPDLDGNYAVIISDGECQVISDCIDYTALSLEKNDQNFLLIFPNPFEDFLTINYSSPVYVRLTNVLGEIVLTSSENELSLDHLTSGIYVVHVFNGQGDLMHTGKVVKRR